MSYGFVYLVRFSYNKYSTLILLSANAAKEVLKKSWKKLLQE